MMERERDSEVGGKRGDSPVPVLVNAKTDTGGDGQQGDRVQLLPFVHCGRQGLRG